MNARHVLSPASKKVPGGQLLHLPVGPEQLAQLAKPVLAAQQAPPKHTPDVHSVPPDLELQIEPPGRRGEHWRPSRKWVPTAQPAQEPVPAAQLVQKLTGRPLQQYPPLQ